MRFRLGEVPALACTPLGRGQIRQWVLFRAWPGLRLLADGYRRLALRRARVVAVVGSFGKSTTTRALRVALNGAPDVGRRGNWTYGLALAMLASSPRARRVVLEVGITGPGQMRDFGRLVRPNVTVVTAVGSEHNRSLGSLEATREEKAEMVRALKPDGLAVLNGDDPNVRWMASQTSAHVVTVGLGADNHVRATDVQLDWPAGTRFELELGGERRAARTSLIGRHQLFAVLAAVAVARWEGLDLDAILASLEKLTPTPGRLEPVELPDGVWLLRDDYKAPVETIDAALDVLAEIPARRRIAVLGDVSEPPGSQGPIYRRLGARLAGVADLAIFVGGSSESYSVGARRAGMSREALIKAERDPLGAAALLRELVRPGDVVLIKGRDTERLDRIGLSLAGRTVRCSLISCRAVGVRCAICPMLESGWPVGRVRF